MLPVLHHDSLERLAADLGVAGRRLGNAIDGLLHGDDDVATLVDRSGLPRRTVERLLRLGADAAALTALRDRVGMRPETPSQPTAAAVARMQALIDAAPEPSRDLDHVGATALTAARRATWLADQMSLDGRRLLLAGDHDLTSLAAAAHLTDTDIVVVDVDERLLDFIDHSARQERLRVTCAYADLTLGLPSSLAASANAVFTDPPYTPGGVGTFLARSIEALDLGQAARIVMAYGFSPDHPALGLQVQRQIIGLELAIESIEPAFNRYRGAQAIGGRSDLYTLIPTTRSPAAARKLARSTGQAIYTHGERSLESSHHTLGAEALAMLSQHAPVVHASVGELLEAAQHRDAGVVAGSLMNAADAWLGRMLLRSRARRLALLVPNSHPDIASQSAQAALSSLVGARYRLRFLRSQPSDRTAIVVADAVADRQPSLLDRPSATLRSALHDTIYRCTRADAERWPKPAVAAVVDELLAEVGHTYGAIGVAELPRTVLTSSRAALESAVTGVRRPD
jgi:hypothetical protein